MIALFIVIGACLGISAFVMVLVRKQKCHIKENYCTKNSDCPGWDSVCSIPQCSNNVWDWVSEKTYNCGPGKCVKMGRAGR